VGGAFLTLLIHAGLLGLVYWGNIKAPLPAEQPRDLMVTRMVKLGKPREKFWLPRIVEPPQPKAPDPVIKVAENPEAAPAVKEEPRPKDPTISKTTQKAYDRARALAKNMPDEPAEGSLSGSASGTSSEASVGDEYATKIMEAVRKNWTVPTGLSVGDVLNLETEIRIAISPSGEITASSVRKSSGNTLYDDSCLQAVQTTRHVPPPPPEVRAMYRRGIALLFGGKDLAR
jgi:colicin import membrane protein